MSINGDFAEFDEQQAARVLGVSHRTLRRWRLAERIEHYRLPGGRIRYSTSQLLDFHRSMRVPVKRDQPAL